MLYYRGIVFALAFAALSGLGFAIAKASPPTYYGNTATAFSPNVSVLYYGAKCDGSTDDTAAFQAAFNAAYTSATGGNGTQVIVPGATCVLNGSVQVKGGVGLRGQGSLATTLLQLTPNVDTFYSGSCCGAGNELNGSMFSDFQVVYNEPRTNSTACFTIAAVSSTQSVLVASSASPWPQGSGFNVDINDGTHQIYGQVTAGWGTTTWTVKTLAIVAGSAGQSMCDGSNHATVILVPTAGATFHFRWSQHLTATRLKTFGGYDAFSLGDEANPHNTTLSRFAIDDTISENVSGWFIHQRGSGGGIETNFTQADGSYDTWTQGTLGGILLQDDNGSTTEGIFVNHAVFGNFVNGFTWDFSVNNGQVQESILDHIQIDRPKAPAILLRTAGTADIERMKFDSFRITQYSGIAVVIAGDAGILTDVRITNSSITGNRPFDAQPCISLTGGVTASIDIIGNQLSECSVGVLMDGGNTGTFGRGNYNVLSNTIGQVYDSGTTVTTGIQITNLPIGFTVIGNRIFATTPISDASTSSQGPRTVLSNSGYIPTLLGSTTGGACPAVPSSGSATAAFDVPVVLSVTLAGATGVSAVVTGNAASPSVSITATGQTIFVPAGATITPTYTGGPPTWVCVGGQ